MIEKFSWFRINGSPDHYYMIRAFFYLILYGGINMSLSLSMFRKWLAAYMLIACVFILAACNSSSSDSGGPVPPAFPSGALTDIGIDVKAPDSGTIESVNTESGSIGVIWNGVAEASAETFISGIGTALEIGGLTSQDDADAKIVTWEYTKDAAKWTVTITYVKQDHELNGSAVKAGRMLLIVEPKSEGSDQPFDDTVVRPLAAYIANAGNQSYKLGIIKGNKDLSSFSVETRVDSIPLVVTQYSDEAHVFAYGNRPKDGSATVVLERYTYARAGDEGDSIFTTFDPKGTIDEAAITANVKDWGSGSNPNYAANARNTVRVGNYLYIMSYDVRRISKVHITTGRLVSSVEYPAIDGYAVKGQDIIVTKGRIFALFAMPDSSFANYLDSIVIEVKHTDNDRAPIFGDEVKVGKNAVSLVSVDDYIYVPSIGGKQGSGTGNGANSRVDRVTLTESGITVDADPVYYADDKYDFHEMVIGKEKTLIRRVFTDSYGQYSYLTYIDTKALHSVINEKVSTIPSSNHLVEPDEDEPDMGWFYPMVYDDVLDHFWVAPPRNLIIYNKDLSEHIEIAPAVFHGHNLGDISSIALFTGELGSSKTSSSSYVPHAVRSGLKSSPEEYYKSLK
jgi:hypothetical protein